MTRAGLAIALAATACAAIVGCPAAAAHGSGGKLTGFRSSVTAIAPPVAGVSVIVRDYDDRLRLTNRSGKTVIILGYEGEPYLSFRSGGVFRNASSPATYLNDDRYGTNPIPAGVSPKARPRWVRVSGSDYYEWHDHRIHWMSPILPPSVQAAKRSPHHVFDWTVEARADAAPFSIHGTLDYTPPASSSFPVLLTIPLIALAALTGGVWWLRRRLDRRSRR